MGILLWGGDVIRVKNLDNVDAFYENKALVGFIIVQNLISKLLFCIISQL
jgi:hypothetical protein